MKHPASKLQDWYLHTLPSNQDEEHYHDIGAISLHACPQLGTRRAAAPGVRRFYACPRQGPVRFRELGVSVPAARLGIGAIPFDTSQLAGTARIRRARRHATTRSPGRRCLHRLIWHGPRQVSLRYVEAAPASQ